MPKEMLHELQFRPVATFSGIRRVPFLALSRNSLFPSLVVRQDGLCIRIIRRHDFAFDDIAHIALSRPLTHQITIVPKRGLFSFSANFFSADSVAEVLAALQGRSAPLDAAARDVLHQRTAPVNGGL
jgi:hypothetical protein